MSRWKAAGLHLLISVVVAILVGSLIYFIWYPPPYFDVAGGSKLMLIIMSVDVVIGPFLTLVVFKAGKKSLRFDLTVIAALQLAAFCYGIFTISLARPVFVVAEVDRFVLVTANQLDDADLAEAKTAEFRIRSWTGPLLIGAVPPHGNGRETLDMVMSGIAGKDIDRFPKYYVPYGDVAETLLSRSKSLQDLLDRSTADAEVVQAFLKKYGGNPADYRCLPLQGRLDGYTMIVSAATKLPLTALAISPW